MCILRDNNIISQGITSNGANTASASGCSLSVVIQPWELSQAELPPSSGKVAVCPSVTNHSWEDIPRSGGATWD